MGRDSDPLLRNLSKEEIENYIEEGPMEDAVCLRCANQTSDDRCEGCIFGHFRGTEDYRVACRPCQCHGHGDTCDPVTIFTKHFSHTTQLTSPFNHLDNWREMQLRK